MQQSSCLYSGNAAFVEALYQRYLDDPTSVGPDWRSYFDRLQTAHDQPRSSSSMPDLTRPASAPDHGNAPKQVAVLQLINAYRFRGHRRANLDPLNQYQRPEVEELDPAYHGLTDADLDQVFNTGSLHGPTESTLREIVETVRRTYCGTIGAEYMHIVETAEKRWLQQRLEAPRHQSDAARKRHILSQVIAAAALEEYLHTKYVGQKRFSLEGGESLIPLLDQALESAGAAGVKEFVIGMAHRGRLNVLVNIVGKHPSELFGEFEGRNRGENRSGDVKYHLGYSSDIETPSGPIHVTLAFNPSHLEIIDPVVEGSVRARQDRRSDHARDQVVPLLIHGDAAFSGQGVVMETFNLSQTRGYTTGGTLHVVINNQVGFTTSDPLDARSTLYCTDVAKMVQAPIFHVNGDDPEAVVFVTDLAFAYRATFKKDVVIDLVCFRKHGHSEADEPSVTQPVMYQHVRNHPGVPKRYADQLINEGAIDAAEPDRLFAQYIAALERNVVVSRPHAAGSDTRFVIDYSKYRDSSWRDPVTTSIPRARIQHLTERLTQLPPSFEPHRAVARLLQDRREMGAGTKSLDWGFAETLAYASLVEQQFPVRLSGQDSGRGTFFHRHAVLHDSRTGATHLPLQHIGPDQAPFLVINSTLSEEAVVGFEYGYACAAPESLVIWEAQFGDFANNAQVVIDQFLASCEQKWDRLCGLVLFLPHGYDGQGPEHSSARLERFLQLCAQENMQVVVPSTPAQMFHLLSRQMLRAYRKPLIVMSPKSLLRHKYSTSALEEIEQGSFRVVIDETDDMKPTQVKRVLCCSGKVYYDLLEARRTQQIEDTAIIRVEQLYPFPKRELQDVIRRYPKMKKLVWVQEEPRNQGAWATVLSRRHLGACVPANGELLCVARPYSASPAAGYLSLHLDQQQALIEKALCLRQNGVDDAQVKSA
jgi:2-oxoglutarate dehydrogenase E1 component